MDLSISVPDETRLTPAELAIWNDPDLRMPEVLIRHFFVCQFRPRVNSPKKYIACTTITLFTVSSNMQCIVRPFDHRGLIKWTSMEL
jgi:hypothetical protein